MVLRGCGIGSKRDFMIREYGRRRKIKIAEYVARRPIYRLCTDAYRMEGFNRLLRW